MSNPTATEELIARRRHRKTFTLATLASAVGVSVVVLPILGYMLSPWAIGVMSNAMADEIAEEVSKQIAPTNAGIKVMIESQIAELDDDISSLMFRRDMCGAVPPCWTAVDAQVLTNKTRRIASQREALAAIRAAERTGRGE